MADQPAPTAPGTVYHVGTMPDGRIILSESGELPVDDTQVWFEDAPDARMTVVELEDANPVQPGTEIAWAAEPQPHQPAAGGQPLPDNPAQRPEDGVEPAEDQAVQPPVAPRSNPAKEPPMGMAAERAAKPTPAPGGDVDKDRAAKAAAVTINGEPPTGAMIALVPEDPEALADPDGDPAEALHVTLKWLGPAEFWDDEQRQMVENVVAAWADEHTKSYKATVGGAGRLGEEGAAVLFLDIDDLHESRSKLSAALYDAVGPDSEDVRPGFVPHLTTGYGTEPRYDLMGEPAWFDSVSVHWGPDVKAYPLNSEVAYIAAAGDPVDDDTGEADDDGRMAEMGEADELSEVEVDRMSDLVDDAEEQVAELEGMVAELVMAQVSDELFLDDDTDADPLPKVATLSDDDVVGYRKALVSFQAGVGAKLAALDDGDLPDDLSGRVDALMERLDALGKSVADMLLGGMADEEMPELPPGSGTFIDETNPNRPGAADDDEEDEDEDEPEEPEEGDDEMADDAADGEESDDEDEDGPPWAKKKRKKGAKTAGTGLPLTVDAREKAADKGAALPDGKLPIRTLVELKSAIKLRNNVKGHSPEAVKAHIVKRARALGATDELPDEWQSGD